MAYQSYGTSIIPPPPPPLPMTAKLPRLSTTLPPPPPPPMLPPSATVKKMNMTKAKMNAQLLKNTGKTPVPGEPGVPVPILGEDYTGRVNSTIDPAYDIYLQVYYADFSVKDKNGFLKLFRMFGNSPAEVIQYIGNFKKTANVRGIMRASEPVTLESIIKQLETLRNQKQQ